MGWLPLVTSGSSLDPATTAWINAVNTAAGSSVVSGARKTLVDTLIKGLKSDGVFSLLDALWMLFFADENQHEGLIDIISLQSATLFLNGGVGTLDANGWTNDGSTGGAFVDTALTPSTFGGHYGLSNGSLIGYVLNSRTTSNAYSIMGDGNTGATDFDFLISRYSDGKAYYVTSDSGADNISTANANAKGAYVGSLVSGTASLYMNGNTTSIVSGTLTAGGSLANQTMIIGARRSGVGVTDTNLTDSIGAAGLGGALTSTQAVAINNRINTCATNLPTPKNVY